MAVKHFTRDHIGWLLNISPENILDHSKSAITWNSYTVRRYFNTPLFVSTCTYTCNCLTHVFLLFRHNGHFGTINNFRLGRLKTVPVSIIHLVS